jgi:predicted nicotinamide N-methyase
MPDGELVSVEQYPSSSVHKRVDYRRNPGYKSKLERLVKETFDEKAGIRKSAAGIAIDPGDTGVTVWDGTLALARYLCHFPHTLSGKRAVVEMGSGTGLLGCIVSRLGVPKTILTDLPHVLPRLKQAVTVNCRGRDVQVLDLEWGCALPETLRLALSHDTHYTSLQQHVPLQTSQPVVLQPSEAPQSSGQRCEGASGLVVVCADLVYHPSAVEPLLQSVEQLLRLGGRGSFALFAQDPHDMDAMAKLKDALGMQRSCRGAGQASAVVGGGGQLVSSDEMREVGVGFREGRFQCVDLRLVEIDGLARTQSTNLANRAGSRVQQRDEQRAGGDAGEEGGCGGRGCGLEGQVDEVKEVDAVLEAFPGMLLCKAALRAP